MALAPLADGFLMYRRYRHLRKRKSSLGLAAVEASFHADVKRTVLKPLRLDGFALQTPDRLAFVYFLPQFLLGNSSIQLLTVPENRKIRPDRKGEFVANILNNLHADPIFSPNSP